MTLGILDWGIGGLGVYRALRRAGSTEDVLYVSDAGRTPYGRQEVVALRDRLGTLAEFFAARGGDEVLVACNAASSVLRGDVEILGGVRFRSILPAAVAVAHRIRGRLGVVGGDRTIASESYRSRLAAGGRSVVFVSAQPLSAFVERGEIDGATVEEAVARVLSAVGPVDALLLACTHYPALFPIFASHAPGVVLLDPAEAIAASRRGARGGGAFEIFTTGDPVATAIAGRRAFGIEVGLVGRIDR
jgi:glutamate racemase